MATIEAHEEVEVKLAIADWRKVETLLRGLPPHEAAFTQKNFYLDDESRTLLRSEIMLRAREIQFPVGAAKGLSKAPVTFTTKRRKSNIDGVFISEERSQVMHYDDWREFEFGRSLLNTSGPLFQWLDGEVNFGKLQIVGLTINQRWKVRSGPYMLEIDQTTFPDDGSIEAEIECETLWPDKAREHIERLCRRLEIEIGPQRKSKYARFLAKHTAALAKRG